MTRTNILYQKKLRRDVSSVIGFVLKPFAVESSEVRHALFQSIYATSSALTAKLRLNCKNPISLLKLKLCPLNTLIIY